MLNHHVFIIYSTRFINEGYKLQDSRRTFSTSSTCIEKSFQLINILIRKLKKYTGKKYANSFRSKICLIFLVNYRLILRKFITLYTLTFYMINVSISWAVEYSVQRFNAIIFLCIAHLFSLCMTSALDNAADVDPQNNLDHV